MRAWMGNGKSEEDPETAGGTPSGGLLDSQQDGEKKSNVQRNQESSSGKKNGLFGGENNGKIGQGTKNPKNEEEKGGGTGRLRVSRATTDNSKGQANGGPSHRTLKGGRKKKNTAINQLRKGKKP